MSEQFKHDEQADVIALFRQIQQQLNFLEKKIDLLIGHHPRRFERGQDNIPEERGFRHNEENRGFGRRHDFKKHDDGKKRWFEHKKKPFFRGRNTEYKHT